MNQWYLSHLYPNFLNLSDHISKCLARHNAPWYTNCKNSSQLFASFWSMMYRVAWSTGKRWYFVQWILCEHIILYVKLRCVAFMVHDWTHILKSSPASIQDKNGRLLHLFSSSILPISNPCNLCKSFFQLVSLSRHKLHI